MAFQVEQKIKGRVYLYEVESFWDKEQKKTRQKRRYLGPKEKIYKKEKTDSKSSPLVKDVAQLKFDTKSFGDTYVANAIQKDLKLDEILKKHFPNDYIQILALSTYLFQEPSPSYLFPFWQDDHCLHNNIPKLHSNSISELYERIGKNENNRLNFIKSWCKHINPKEGIYYDITSISSYSTNNENIEWGYNRDKEYLPQINLGYTCCQKTSLPLSYRVHPGSIVDVTTLKNTIKIFNSFNLKNIFFILDRGFCSVGNIKEMYKNKMYFIQPMLYSLKKTKDLLLKHKTRIVQQQNMFKYNNEIFYHKKDIIELDKNKFNAHIFYNEKLSVAYKHSLYNALLEIEKRIGKFKNEEECKKYYEENIPNKYQQYFIVKKDKILRNISSIETSVIQSGTIIFIVHGKTLSAAEILSNYKGRDKIEKEINILRNQIDCKRLRAHNVDTSNGRLFIKFISLIQATEFIRRIKKEEKIKNNSLQEIILELKKLKINTVGENNNFLSELTKKQKIILKALDINIDTMHELHGY